MLLLTIGILHIGKINENSFVGVGAGRHAREVGDVVLIILPFGIITDLNNSASYPLGGQSTWYLTYIAKHNDQNNGLHNGKSMENQCGSDNVGATMGNQCGRGTMLMMIEGRDCT